jgi:hypothetical protein
VSCWLIGAAHFFGFLSEIELLRKIVQLLVAECTIFSIDIVPYMAHE